MHHDGAPTCPLGLPIRTATGVVPCASVLDVLLPLELMTLEALVFIHPYPSTFIHLATGPCNLERGPGRYGS